MNKKEKISSVSLRSIEDSLSNVKIDSVTTMDQLLSMSLYQGIYCGDYFNGTLIRRIKLKLNLFNHKINFKKFFNKRKTKILDNIQNADGFITFSYDREDLIHLSAIVMKRLLADYVKIQPIIYDQSIQNSRLFKTLSDQNDFDSVNITDILSLYDIGWSKKYKKSIMQAEKILAKKCKEFGLLNTFLMDNLKLDIRKQIIFYSSCIKFLKNKNPKFIIVESDRNNLSSPLVMASKKLLIPSFSLMHGNVQYDFGYVPILADQLLVWGAYQKKRLIKYGANEDQIRITGVPQFSNHIDGNKDDILQKLNIDKEKKIVILATSNYSDISIRIKLVKIFFRSLQELSKIGWHGVIKLHPRDDISLYKDYFQYDYLSIFSFQDLNKNIMLVKINAVSQLLHGRSTTLELPFRKIEIIYVTPHL